MLLPKALSILFLIAIYGRLLPETGAHKDWIFSYQWKEQKGPIYSGDSVKELLALCPKGCNNSLCNITDCDKDFITSLRQAQKETKDFQDFASHSPLYFTARIALLIIIVLMVIFLFIKGHFRIRDLKFLNVENQWQIEDDPTSGFDPTIWANMNVTVHKQNDPNAKPVPVKEFIINPITLGDIFWKFRKVFSLFYGRERFYRLARSFDPLDWQLKNLGKVINKTVEEDEEDAEATATAYDWKTDVMHNAMTSELAAAVGINEDNVPKVLPPLASLDVN